MLKTGIYVDAENIRMCGGYGMRYDVLVELANAGNSTLLRANSYLAEDRERTKDDADYRQKLYRYHDVIRQCGFKVIKKNRLAVLVLPAAFMLSSAQALTLGDYEIDTVADFDVSTAASISPNAVQIHGVSAWYPCSPRNR